MEEAVTSELFSGKDGEKERRTRDIKVEGRGAVRDGDSGYSPGSPWVL